MANTVRQTWARDAESDGGEAGKPITGAETGYADTARGTQRTPEPTNPPISGPRNCITDEPFDTWNGAAGGPAPAEPEIQSDSK